MFVTIMDVVFLTLQVQENVRERITRRKTTRKEQENPDNTWNPSPAEIDDFVTELKCFHKNSAGSACPNIEKGVFVSSEEVRDLLERLR